MNTWLRLAWIIVLSGALLCFVSYELPWDIIALVLVLLAISLYRHFRDAECECLGPGLACKSRVLVVSLDDDFRATQADEACQRAEA
ncbi:hypothetical protein [Dyella sp. C11]|uniref:hypothetical protein n=1 Tax=Dyella sp. C11 TaxID=2126991 RepID=UPI0013008E10|nr:hypothetical protein [Dyella sp. C11]